MKTIAFHVEKGGNKGDKEICPCCCSDNLEHYADHASHGFNGYKCRNCGYHWGN